LRGRNARRKRRGVWTVLLTALGLFLVACAKDAPQDTLSPVGPVAQQADNLFRPVFWIATAIFVLVEGMLVYVLWRFRRRSDADAPKQTHGNTRLEIIWTIIPAVLLAGIGVPTVLTIFDVAKRPVGANVIHVKVTGHQWWWEYEYTDFKVPEGGNLKTANELVIPTGRWVNLDVTSADVIHSFWVPKLAGKQDAVPGKDNFIKLRAEKPGFYEGQCAEYCALSHANMRLRVFAHTPADFDAWVQGQIRPAPMPTDATVLGRLISTCANCHTVRGVQQMVGGEVKTVAGTTAPDLTHFASRSRFAGSMFDRTEANLARWLDNPDAMKPLFDPPDPNGPKMPDYGLSQAEIDALVAYLMSLQ
jgi:cytochrome c oxidase subunit 2